MREDGSREENKPSQTVAAAKETTGADSPLKAMPDLPRSQLGRSPNKLSFGPQHSSEKKQNENSVSPKKLKHSSTTRKNAKLRKRNDAKSNLSSQQSLKSVVATAEIN